MSPKEPPDPETNPFDIPPDTVRTPPSGMPQVDDRAVPRDATTTSPRVRPATPLPNPSPITAEETPPFVRAPAPATTPLRRSQPPEPLLGHEDPDDATRLHHSQAGALPGQEEARRRSQPPEPRLGAEDPADQTRLHHSHAGAVPGRDERRRSQPPVPVLGADEGDTPSVQRVDEADTPPRVQRSSGSIPPPVRGTRSTTPPPTVVRPSVATTPPAGTRPSAPQVPSRATPPPPRLKSSTTPPRSRAPSEAELRAGSIMAEDPTTMSGKYVFGDALGRGGMGEVMLAHDRQIGRDVAVKRLRSASPAEDEVSRFLREARIQARLDHPAIVPVYELSKDELGRPYFSMKRLAGKTLTQVLEVATRQRMLRAFADVCRAVDFAHSRGIVHRDLKPANIILGEFGEVYVIDWGVARVLGDAAGLVTADIDTMEGSAPANQTLGTPGYMAPEQLEDPEVGRPADIYSLGTILFEILAGETFHPRDHAIESTRASTLSTSPAARRPERGIPPELDAMCSVMLSKKASLRPTARWCADRIEEYLDGDRDLAHRRTMANEMVWAARAALDGGRRAEAMRISSRALALDPQAPGAAELVTMLMLDPPKTPPEDLREALRNSDAIYISHHARGAIPGYVLIALFLPLIVLNGVLDWTIVLGIVASALGMAFAAWQLVKKPNRSLVWMIAYAIGNSFVLVLLGRLGGAFAFVPALVSYITASVITYPAFLERKWVLISIMVTGFLIPFGLEIGNVLDRTWELQAGGIMIRGSAMDLSGSLAMFTIIAASVATVVMAGIQYAKLGRTNRDAQHRLVTLAWHLRQLLPAPSPAVPHSQPLAIPR